MVLVDFLVGVIGDGSELRGQGDLEKVRDTLLQGTLIAFEAKDIVAVLGNDLRGDGALASMVTMAPLSSSISSNLGIAVISLDFSSVAS